MVFRNSDRWHVGVWLILLTVTTAGCRCRSACRTSPRPVALPPPVVSEGFDESEVPITIPSTPGSSYGPVISQPPLGGSSRDIRYRQSPRARAIPVEPPVISLGSPDGGRTPAPSSRETPITVPSTRNGADQSSTSRSKNGAASEEVTGIPKYLVLEANVATGGPPTLDGIKWLKERGFKTVLCLETENEVDPAEASMIRELGMEFISLPIAPHKIDRQTMERFNEIVDGAEYRPIFLHDSNGARTGAMWYLHRVLVDQVPEQQARSQASRIGLQDSDTDFWLAIQRYVSENR